MDNHRQARVAQRFPGDHRLLQNEDPCNFCACPFSTRFSQSARCRTCRSRFHEGCLNTINGQNGHCMMCIGSGIVSGSTSASSSDRSVFDLVRTYSAAVPSPHSHSKRMNYIQCGSCQIACAVPLARQCSTCSRLSHPGCLSIFGQCQIRLTMGIRPRRHTESGHDLRDMFMLSNSSQQDNISLDISEAHSSSSGPITTTTSTLQPWLHDVVHIIDKDPSVMMITSHVKWPPFLVCMTRQYRILIHPAHPLSILEGKLEGTSFSVMILC